MSNLVFEILLRLAKARRRPASSGVVLYVVLVGPFGATGSAELALLCWLERRGLHPARRDEPDLTGPSRSGRPFDRPVGGRP